MSEKRALGVYAIALCAFASHAIAQSPPEAMDDHHRFAQIHTWVAATQRDLKTNRVVKRDLSGFSSEGGHLEAFYSGDTLRKLDAWWYGESGRAHAEFYVRDGELYFVLTTDDRYDHSEQRSIVHSYHTRLYFDNDRLIAWTDSTGRKRAPTGPAAEEQKLDALRGFREIRRCAVSASSEPCEASRNSSAR